MNKVVKNFENQFQEEVIELLIVPKSSVGGAGVLSGYLNPSLTFMAYADPSTGVVEKKTGRLEWLIKDDETRKNFGYPFEGLVVYHVKVRKCIEQKLAPYMLEEMNNRYMLLDVLGENVPHAELNAITTKYAEPVFIKDNKLGEFELNREFDFFEGEVDWLGNSCLLSLSVDDDDESSATHSFSTLQNLFSDLANWDSKLRTYAATSLTELANEWQEEDDERENAVPITLEDFAKRMSISELSISSDGDMEVYFNDDDMFWGHVIIVSANISGEITGAQIAG